MTWLDRLGRWFGFVNPPDPDSRFLLTALAGKPGSALPATDLYNLFSDRYESYADFWEDMLQWERLQVVTTFEGNGEDYVRLRAKPFDLVLNQDGEPAGIRCHVCRYTSYVAHDVSHHYCSHCRIYLNGELDVDPE